MSSNNPHKTIGIFKHNPEAIIPTYGTEKSACFDLYACLKQIQSVEMWFPQKDKKPDQLIQHDIDSEKSERKSVVEIPPGARALIPTGLIFEIPEDYPWIYSVRVHTRSGQALKRGLDICLTEGIIDCDYVEPVFIPIRNTNEYPITIEHGERIAQAEIVCDYRAIFIETDARPQRTTRSGGFGSTGQGLNNGI